MWRICKPQSSMLFGLILCVVATAVSVVLYVSCYNYTAELYQPNHGQLADNLQGEQQQLKSTKVMKKHLKYVNYCNGLDITCNILYVGKQSDPNYDECSDGIAVYGGRTRCPDFIFGENPDWVGPELQQAGCNMVFKGKIPMYQTANVTYAVCQNITIDNKQNIFVFTH